MMYTNQSSSIRTPVKGPHERTWPMIKDPAQRGHSENRNRTTIKEHRVTPRRTTLKMPCDGPPLKDQLEGPHSRTILEEPQRHPPKGPPP